MSLGYFEVEVAAVGGVGGGWRVVGGGWWVVLVEVAPAVAVVFFVGSGGGVGEGLGGEVTGGLGSGSLVDQAVGG